MKTNSNKKENKNSNKTQTNEKIVELERPVEENNFSWDDTDFEDSWTDSLPKSKRGGYTIED